MSITSREPRSQTIRPRQGTRRRSNLGTAPPRGRGPTNMREWICDRPNEGIVGFGGAQPGERVLDIGCGPGTTVLELARRVGLGGYVLGAHVSKPSVARACERIATASLRHAEANVADSSVHPFTPVSFELAFSRFGIMFFSDPVAAFENVRRAMRLGGDWRWQCSAQQARRCGRTPYSKQSVPCFLRSRRPGPRSQALSHGPIRGACVGSWKAAGLTRFH